MNELAEKILAQIARVDSKRPARAADVAALVGGDEREFWATVEQLIVHRQINTALIHRPKQDAEPWLAIWPTGVCLRDKGWTGDSHRGLFERPGSMREAVHGAHAPKVRAEQPAPNQTQEKQTVAIKAKSAAPAPLGSSQKAVLDVLYQNPCTDMSCSELAALTGKGVENAYSACQGLIKRELIERAPDGKRYRLPAPLGEPCGPADTPTEAPAETPVEAFADAPAEPPPTEQPEGDSPEQPEPSGAFQAELLHLLDVLEASPEAPVPTDELALLLNTGIDNVNQALRRLLRRGLVERRMVLSDKRRNAYVYWPMRATADALPRSSAAREATGAVRIGLWDDGSLTIIDGDDVLQYPPDVTARLARLLGVPSDTSHPLTHDTGA